MSKPNDQALVAFMTSMSEIQAQLALLTRYVDDHMEVLPDNIHWGHVGSVRRTLELLTDATQFLNLK